MTTARPTPWSACWSRRDVLAAAAGGLVAAACGPARAMVHGASASGSASSASRSSAIAPSASGFPIVVRGGTAQDLASFAAFSRGQVAPVPTMDTRTSSGASAVAARWEIDGAVPFALPNPGQFTAVDTALRQVNFQPSVLLPGAYDAFSGTDGNHYAVPTWARPWGVQYDASVFQQVGLDDPAPDWTIDDFEDCCTVIAAAMARGDLPHLRSVLPQLIGTTYPPKPSTGSAPVVSMPIFGQFIDPALWGAFIVGFGGTVVTGGRFDLTNPGAVAGLQRMADLAARFGPPASAGTLGASAIRFEATASVADPNVPQVVNRGAGQWARFPVLPVQAIVPASVGGFVVLPASKGGGFMVGAGFSSGAPPEALVALADYALWWYERDRTTPGLAGLPPPVIADAAVQKAYWQAKQRPAGFAAVGDWNHFEVVGAGWPLVPLAFGQQVWYAGEPTSPVYDALTTAVQNRVPVSGLVAQATKQLNNMADSAKPRASNSAAGPGGGG